MSSFVSHTSVDCADAYALSGFWKQVLGYEDDPEDPREPGDEGCVIRDPESGHTVLFLEVPESKTVKNRMHFDLRPREGTRDAELERLRGIGAVEIADHRGKYGPGSGWVVLADPEGNEFCILRSEAEVAAMQGSSSNGDG
ncbi:VOC family protein [Brachybacterium sp. GCM10030267]|uniref:VOC family protein n=1 Tax=unclassified Brachybacterium TaxID=2623841 RepID=UPI003621A7BF